MRTCTHGGGNRRGRLDQACEFGRLGVQHGNGSQESGRYLGLHRLRLPRRGCKRCRRGSIVVCGNDGSGGVSDCDGRCHIDPVRLIRTHDQHRRDDSRSELAWPQQASTRWQRRRGESRWRHACRGGDAVCRCRRRRRVSRWQPWRSAGRAGWNWIRCAALVAVRRRLVIDRIALFARLQMQRRGACVAEPGITRIPVVAERAHPVAEIRSARSEGPVRRAS